MPSTGITSSDLAHPPENKHHEKGWTGRTGHRSGLDSMRGPEVDRGGVAGDPDRRASRDARASPSIRTAAIAAALQAVLRAVPWCRWRVAQTVVRSVGAQRAALQELHEGSDEARRGWCRGRDLDAVRRHPRLDGPRRAPRAGVVRDGVDGLLP